MEMPVLNAAGTKIAFVQWDLYGSMWTMNADGSVPTTILGGDFDNNFPSWRPDGQKLLYSDNSSGIFQLMLCDPTGTNATALTSLPDGAWKGRFSPDGTKIVFVCGITNDDIYIMNADGTNVVQLTSDSSDETNPSFSPDGTKIVYTRNYGGSGWNGQIMTMNVNGSSQTRLTTSNESDDEAMYTSNGSHIVFTRQVGNGREIYIMAADGTGATRLTNDGANASRPFAVP